MFEAYSVAVRLKLVNGVSEGILLLSKQFKGAHLNAVALRKELSAIKTTMLVGGGMIGAGAGMFYLLGKTLPAAREYANQLSLLNTLGMKQADIARTVGEAWKTTYAVPTSTAAGNLAMFRELRSAFGAGKDGEAAAMLPTAARIQGILQALTGKPSDHVGFDLVKSIELRSGIMTPAALQRNAELMTRTMLAMGGTLGVGDFHSTLKMAKTAGANWSDEFVYEFLPTLMQEVKTRGGGSGGGAQSAGTYLRTLDRAIQGHMLKSSMPYWVGSGLVKASDIVKNSTGAYQMRPGSVAGTDLFNRDPFKWSQQFLAPAVERIMAKQHVSMETAVGALFSDRNADFVAFNMLKKSQQYMRDQQLIRQADGLGGYNKLLQTNPDLAFSALKSQWQNVMAVMGYSLMPTLIQAAQALIPTLQSFTAWARANPNGIAAFMKGLAGFATLLVAGGAVTSMMGLYRALKLLSTVLTGGALAGGAAGGGLEVAATGAALALGRFLVPLAAIAAIVALKNGVTGTGTPGNGDWKPNWTAGKGWLGIDWSKPLFDQGGASPFVPKGGSKQQGGAGNVYLDGAKVGKILSGHLVKGMSGPQTSASFFDPSMTMAPVALGGAH